MKDILVLSIVFFMSVSSLAEELTVFKCGNMGHGTTFSVQFGGPRYADAISINYLGKEIKKLLPLSEAQLQTMNESLTSFISMGNCRKINVGPVLVVCELNSKKSGIDWDASSINFTTSEQLAEGFNQSNNITRSIQISNLDLKVINESKRAKLKLEMTVDTAHQKNIAVKIERDLGPLTHDWHTCKFE